MEYLVSSSHVTALAGKAIIDHYYGQNSSKILFHGLLCRWRTGYVASRKISPGTLTEFSQEHRARV